ncbi:MAG: PAAR domain-containing protein [Rhodanobacteraceae bacterium]|nr:PAAR domain-containing protein [Rhodanobacteraceae bacterium]
MPAAARIGDPTSHPGLLAGAGLPTVLIEQLPAARVSDQHVCAFPPPTGPHPPNAVIKGSTSVFIGGQPAARQGDTCGCGAQIVSGALSVTIGG